MDFLQFVGRLFVFDAAAARTNETAESECEQKDYEQSQRVAVGLAKIGEGRGEEIAENLLRRVHPGFHGV